MELIDWACNGFFPCGPQGLWPTSQDQEQIQVIPFEEERGPSSTASKAVSTSGDGDDPPKKKAKVMLVHMKKKGE